MKRILILLASVFFLSSVTQADHANHFGEGFDSIQAKIYINENCNSPPSAKCVLVISDDGHYVAWSGRSLNVVRKHALAICHSRSSEPNTCKVVDENMQSDFIRAYLGANSGDSAESVAMTGWGWCVSDHLIEPYRSDWLNCSDLSRSFYPTREEAIASMGKSHQKVAPDSETPANNNLSQIQSSEAVASQPTEADKNIELEFWQSIKDSNDPDMFREYLRQFPSGTFEGIAKIKIQKLTGSTTSVAQASIPNLDYGNYHALVIGNNRYQNFKDLNTPINDARTVSRILQTSYGFKVDVLENATESEMFKAIVELRSNVGRNDNVLIYFGGHGELDRDTEEGFWIPSDARRDDPSTYIPVDRIRKQIKAMSAKHVMVVADSCFSGSLTRSTLTRALKVKPRSPEYQSELQRIIDKKSRTALTSGGLEPVLDSGGDGHSVFASALISALRDNDGILDAHELFIQVRKKVRNNSPQDPEYSPIYETGHDGGDFLFVRR